jgi:hypothetical protein
MSANGDEYVGGFKGSEFNGKGTMSFADRHKYVGDYKDGKRHGQGVFTFADGGKYVGEWKDNNRNGQGTSTLANGDQYVGEFSGDKYFGGWKSGNRHGQGIVTFADGSKWDGEFKDDNFNGKGTITLSDGLKYVGEVRNNKANGQGILTGADGVVRQTGRWVDGIFIGELTPNKAAAKIEPRTLAERATQGDADAQYRYGMTFILGEGDELKPRVAIEWLMKAQAQGHEGAKKQIVSMYDLGVQMSTLPPSIQVRN